MPKKSGITNEELTDIIKKNMVWHKETKNYVVFLKDNKKYFIRKAERNKIFVRHPIAKIQHDGKREKGYYYYSIDKVRWLFDATTKRS